MSDLPWRVAWITGASTGIGRELALLLARRGVSVAASARSVEKLENLGMGIRAYPLDVTDPQAVLDTHDRISRELGTIDLAILAAGTYRPLEIDRFDIGNFTTTNAVNYLGVIHALGALVPSMRQRGSGHAAWIASVAGYRVRGHLRTPNLLKRHWLAHLIGMCLQSIETPESDFTPAWMIGGLGRWPRLFWFKNVQTIVVA